MSTANATANPLERDVLSFARHCRAGNLSPKTTQTYTESARLLATYLVEQGMPTDLEGIRREHVEAFIVDQLDRYKPATAHNRYRGVQAFFKWAVDEGLVAVSPMAKMRPPKLPEQPVEVLTAREMKALLAVVDGDKSFIGRRDSAIIRVLLDTGIRRAEAAGLRWQPDDETSNDVDLETGVLRVIGKGRRERVVPIGKKSVVALDRYLRLRDKHPWVSLPNLWLGQKGALTDSGIGQMVKERGDAAGLDHLHPHRLRHTYAHMALSAGMQETDLMRLAGWRSRAMVQKYGASTGTERALSAGRKFSPGDKM
jgi:site-specific recombinase XerD